MIRLRLQKVKKRVIYDLTRYHGKISPRNEGAKQFFFTRSQALRAKKENKARGINSTIRKRKVQVTSSGGVIL